MAYIDLKQCQFLVKDGYLRTGTANITSGPLAAGASSVTIQGFASPAIRVGARVKFAGHDTLYQITATIETSGATTNITLDKVTTASIADDEVVTVGPVFIEARLGDGNMTYDEKRVIEYKLNRGKLDQTRLGDEQPLELNFQFGWEWLKSVTGEPVTIVEAIKRKGAASTWVSTGGNCEPYACDLEILETRDCDDEDYPVQVITLPEFRYEQLSYDPKTGLITCTGKCNVTDALIERLEA